MATRLVRERNGFEVGDPRLRAVAGADSVEPLAGIEALRRFLRLPLVDTAGDRAVMRADELLAEKPRNREEVGGDLGKVRTALFEADGGREVVKDDGGDHCFVARPRLMPAGKESLS